MFCAMKSVNKEDKDKGIVDTQKYALAFFRLLSMSETIENNSPNDGQNTDFELNDVNRLLKSAILGKLKNINTWNMQRERPLPHSIGGQRKYSIPKHEASAQQRNLFGQVEGLRLYLWLIEDDQ